MIDKIAAAKELFGEHLPYSVRIGIDGTKSILLNSHFTGCVRSAMSDGCTARMGKAERVFWNAFIEYQDDIQDGTRDDVDVTLLGEHGKELELAYAELSGWIVDELAGTAHTVVDCYVTDYKVV